MKLSRFSGLLLVVSLTTALFAGCTKGADKPEASPTGSAAASAGRETAASDPAPAPEHDWEIDTSPIKLTIFVNAPENPDGEFSNFWGKNPVTQKITEETGVTPEVIYAPDESGSKLNLMIASDDMPDLILMAYPDQEKEMIKNGMLLELEELAKTAAPNFMSMMPAHMVLSSKLMLDTPGFYKVLRGWARPEVVNKYNLAKNAAGPTFVKEVLDEFGNPPIETGDDYINLLKQALAKYPDMIAHSARYGDTDDDGNPRLVEALMNYGGVLRFYEKDGKIRTYFDDPGFVNVVKFANRLYTEKLVFQDEFLADSNVRRANLAAGKVIAELQEDYDNLVFFGDQLASGNKHGFKQYEMLDAFRINPDRDPAFAANTYSGWDNGFVIPKSSKNAERAIRFVEYLFSDDVQRMMMFGVEGIHHDMVDGEPVLRQEFVEAYKADSLKTRADTGIMYLHFMRNDEWQARMYQQIYGAPDYVAKALERTNAFAVDATAFEGLNSYPKDSEEMKIFANIKEYYSGEIVKIVIGNPADVESGYHKLLQELNKLGLERLNEFVNNAYHERQKKIAEYSK